MFFDISDEMRGANRLRALLEFAVDSVNEHGVGYIFHTYVPGAYIEVEVRQQQAPRSKDNPCHARARFDSVTEALLYTDKLRGLGCWLSADFSRQVRGE